MKPLYIDKFVGIDFQKETTTIALIGRTLAGMGLLDYRIWRDGSKNLEKPDKQSIENLSNFVKQNKLSNIRGAFCFPRHDIILKYIDIPTPKKENINDILGYEIERHVPLDKEDIYYDFQITKQKEENLFTILIAVSRKSQVDRYINLLKEASITPSVVSISTASNFNLLSFNNYDRKIFNAVIEIGFRNATISFVLDGTVNYTRNVPILENENWMNCLSEKSVSEVELETTSESFVEFLTKEINLSLAGYREIPSGKTIDCFYLSGGGLLATHIKKHLEERISGTVRLLDPLAKIRNDGISDDDRSFLANAIGTGIQNHVKSNFSINFLPYSLRKYAEDNSFKTMLVLLGVSSFILLSIAFSSILSENLKLTKIENELKMTKKEVIVAENLEREYERMSHQKLILQGIKNNNPGRLGILKELTSLLSADVWLTNLVIKQDASEITGSANSASKLIPLLERSDYFTNVKFTGSIRHIKNREQFKITLPFKKVTVK